MSLFGHDCPHDRRTVKSWKAAPEEMSLEATGKDGQWRCWRDVLRKTVPDTKGGDRKSSVTDGWQPHMADNQWRCRGGTQTTLSFGVCWLAEFVGEVRRCCTLPTLVDKESQLVRTSVCQGLEVECCHRITYMYMVKCRMVCLVYADGWYLAVLAGLQELLH